MTSRNSNVKDKSQSKTKVDRNEPIALSGAVYAFKILALDRPDLALPEGRALQRGDLKLIAIERSASDRSRKARGLFTAYIHDGKSWRKFALRDGAALTAGGKIIRATYDSNTERVNRLGDIAHHLRSLREQDATWTHKSYAVVIPRKTGPKVQKSLF